MKVKNWQLLSIYHAGHETNNGNIWSMGSPFFYIYAIFPYAVGYFKQEYSYYTYEPSVETALESAYEFWTKSENSSYISQGRYMRNFYDIITELKSSNNRYYYFYIDNYGQQPESVWDKYSCYTYYHEIPFDINGVDNTYMYNGYYKVYDARVWLSKWKIHEDILTINSDKQSLRIKWAIWLTVVLLAIIIPLIVMEKKKQKLQSESLYDKLKRLCNPSNFIKNYDKEKVDAANEIYQRLLQTSPDDKELMDEIQKQAVERLKISLIEPSLLNELRKKVNPQNFMKNYDAEKVSLANDLYARLSKDNLTYNEFIEIQELSKQL